jgi:hypothetical protein
MRMILMNLPTPLFPEWDIDSNVSILPETSI